MSIDFREVGAQINGNECFFKVWAPDAQDVYTVFEKEGWQKRQDHKLNKVDGDYWQGTLHDVGVGDEYRYLIIPKEYTEYNEEAFRKIDPAARDTLHSNPYDKDNNAIIVSPSYNWAPFVTPKYEDFIIYQVHPGTFAGTNDEFSQEVNNLPDKIAKFKHIKWKLGYIRDLGFNAIQLMPIQEFKGNQSYGYEPTNFFAVESAYGTPDEFREFVNEAHKIGLAVLVDVVYNHVGNALSKDNPQDNPFLNYDIDGQKIYLSEYQTSWGTAPAFWKNEVKDFFVSNAKMYFREYNIDGMRVDATRAIEDNRGWGNDGWRFLQHLTWCLKEEFPNKYIIAEHLPEHDTIINGAGFHAIWFVNAHHEFQKMMEYEFHPEYGDPIDKLKYIVGKNFGYGHNYEHQWRLVKYLLGSHDDVADFDKGGTIWKPNIDERHRYFADFFGGRENEYAREKARLGWALNVAMMGNPMMFMGLECHMPGYWHDSEYDGHRFNWSVAGDHIGMPMRNMVRDVNWVRWNNPALRNETIDIVHEDYDNKVLAFKRYVPGGDNVILTIVNVSSRDFGGHSYGAHTGGQRGQWEQIFCSQDPIYGGREGVGNAFYQPWTQGDGRIYINVPRFSVVMMKLIKYEQ
ncbi:MAG: alpha-amylase family glycosyl hydrolase [Clostridia bacterium]|nr:alpha-amylase family glycosyl hydrolase [Clostridia bacterium]